MDQGWAFLAHCRVPTVCPDYMFLAVYRLTQQTGGKTQERAGVQISPGDSTVAHLPKTHRPLATSLASSRTPSVQTHWPPSVSQALCMRCPIFSFQPALETHTLTFPFYNKRGTPGTQDLPGPEPHLPSRLSHCSQGASPVSCPSVQALASHGFYPPGFHLPGTPLQKNQWSLMETAWPSGSLRFGVEEFYLLSYYSELGVLWILEC